MNSGPHIAVVVAIATIGTGIEARADADETRLSFASRGTMSTLSAFEGSGTTELVGGTLALAKGLRNWIDVGLVASYAMRSDAAIEDAVLAGNGGEGFHLYTHVQVFDLSINARTYLEAGPFLRWRPLLGARLGAQALRYGEPELFGPGPGHQLVAQSGTAWRFAPVIALESGLAWRASDSIQGALVFGVEATKEQRTISLSLEISWMSYWL